jgi:molecular chaperone HtpG
VDTAAVRKIIDDIYVQTLQGCRKSRQASSGDTFMEQTFQVDLRGLVDLLSRHLYGSPGVYVRELLQNAVDAITARRSLDPGAPAVITVHPSDATEDGTFRIEDTGVGLTEQQVHEFLATIGRSSKRDEIGFARSDFLGQFGIGLLSCFLVSDRIEVVTRSAHGGPTLCWTGHADGRYQITNAPTERSQPGSTVTLTARPGMAHWLTGDVVGSLTTRYGSFLPIPITIAASNGPADPELRPTRIIAGKDLPWRDPAADRTALTELGRTLFEFAPLDVINLAVPEAGLTGVAFVLPVPANPADRGGHHVYLRRMLLSDSESELLPPWAFFVRCVVNTTELVPTASREALAEDDLLFSTRETLGNRLRDWLVRLAATDPHRLSAFLQIHHLGVKALAVHDVEMLRVIDQWWPMDTTLGPMPLAEFRRRYRTIRYTATADEFREIAPIAAAQGVGVINGGYAYDADLIQRLPTIDPDITVARFEPDDLTARFAAPDPAQDARVTPFLAVAADALQPLGCQPMVRAFDPPTVPALYLISRAAIRAEQMRDARTVATGPWADVLATLDESDRSDADLPPSAPVLPQLVLNFNGPLVRRLLDLDDPDLVSLGVRTLYGQALLSGHHPLRPEDGAAIDGSLLHLLDRATHCGTGSR